jgi:type VI secretion system protein ImpE
LEYRYEREGLGDMQAVLAEERLSAGRLQESLVALQDEVRRDPSDVKKRIFLFQLLAIEGNWERARNQLDACLNLDKSSQAMVEVYRAALHAEGARHAVFAGKASPTIFGEPQEWTAGLVDALRLAAEGETSRANELRLHAFDSAQITAGEVDGHEFEWIGDADSRLGPVLEAVLNGQYMWIPFNRIRAIRVEAPTDLRDFVWLPAAFTWTNGGDVLGLIPSRYPGSESHADNSIRMARRTEWQPIGDEQFSGMGQRMLATDCGEFALMDVRHIEFRTDHG